MSPRTSRLRKLATSLLALAFVACSSFVLEFNQPPSVLAEDAVAFEAEKGDLRRQIMDKTEPEARIKAAKRLADLDVKGASDLVANAFDLKKLVKEPKGREVLDAFAEALGRFRNKESVEAVKKEVLSKNMAKAENIYTAYLILKGFAYKPNEHTLIALREALENAEKEPQWLQLAALEAIGDSHDQIHVKTIRDFLGVMRDGWKADLSIVPASALDTLGRIYVGTKENEAQTIEILDEIIERINKDWESVDHIKASAGIAFARIAKLKKATTSVSWLSSYLENRKGGAVDKSGRVVEPTEKKGNTDVRGPKFMGMPALKRIVYCIDISDSMNEDVSDDIKKIVRERDPVITGEAGKEDEKEKKKGLRERIDWDSIKTKMDLAKASLVLSLQDIPVGDRKNEYYFNVVTYSTESQLINESETGFIKATEASINRMIELVKELSTDKMTNIHGALLDAYRVTSKGAIPEDANPAYNANGILYGANTIFFLTDGWGSWSDDSTPGNKVSDQRRSDTTPVIGDGAFIYGPDILADFVRLNKFRKCIVNCVGIGNHDKELMRGLAAKSGGEYIDLSGNTRK